MDYGQLMAVASREARFNCPIDEPHARRLATWVGEGARTLLDLGCGRGEVSLLAIAENPTLRVTGIDIADDLINLAQAEAQARELSDRVSFLVQDATQWTHVVDAVMCVGAEHAFGGIEECVARLAKIVPVGRALLGASYWHGDPNGWCLGAFGPLPGSLAELCDIASAAGWRVEDSHASTPLEWDGFESAWRAGVESVGTEDAVTFAETRRRQYEEKYRSILGFGWLSLVK